MKRVEMIEKEQVKEGIPAFKAGDTVKVFVKIKEGEKERLQTFEGIVIRQKSGLANASFTVRKISYGVGVERTFPLYSPNIDKIKVVTVGRVRRAKLYYLRDLVGKSARIKEKREYQEKKKV